MPASTPGKRREAHWCHLVVIMLYLTVPSRAGAKGFSVLDWLCKNNNPSHPHLLPLLLLLLLLFTFCLFFIFCFYLSTLSSFSVSSFLFLSSLPSFLNICFFSCLQSPAGRHFRLWLSLVFGISFCYNRKSTALSFLLCLTSPVLG